MLVWSVSTRVSVDVVMVLTTHLVAGLFPAYKITHKK